MSVDLKQFYQVFIEESLEGLDAMESGLMSLDVDRLDVDRIDPELINTIFRSAHSIKGGAGTFGFTALASFTHVLETLLDDVRSGKFSLEPKQVDTLLQSVDVMREMLSLLQKGRNEYTPEAEIIKQSLEAYLHDKALTKDAEALSDKKPSAAEANDCGTLQVTFLPYEHLFETGNDPLKMLSNVQQLEGFKSIRLISSPPPWHAYKPLSCYVGWEFECSSATDKKCILDIFEWVADDSQLTFLYRTEAVGQSCDDACHAVYRIDFSPDKAFFLTGNDPLKVIAALGRACTIQSCEVQLDPAIKRFSQFDPEKSYCSWRFRVSDVNQDDIDEVFAWIRDLATIDMDLEVSGPSLHRESSYVPTKQPSVAVLDATESKKEFAATAKSSVSVENSSIRVGIDKIDSLINMVGELVITQSMLGQLGSEFDIKLLPKLLEGLSQLEQNTRELQESVMRIRMLPISFAFSRFPRMVRDLGQTLGKKINLVLLGENTELDKTVMEKITDPLVHLVRNSVDHGIETAEERIQKGKPAAGVVTLNAYHQGGNVIIEIMDDGKGLDRVRIAEKGVEKGFLTEAEAQSLPDEAVFDLIFKPGFSTAKQVSDLSGRGVGMDVVKRNIQALNGVVEIQSKHNAGTKIKISLPLTLAILDGQLARVSEDIYIFPLIAIVESLQYKEDAVSYIAGGCTVFKLREEYVPIIDLAKVFGCVEATNRQTALMVVVECDGYKVALLVDELLAQQQVVIKSLEQNYQKVEGISGATILGDGTVALIIDVPGVVRLAGLDAVSLRAGAHPKGSAVQPLIIPFKRRA
jgi:two-component system, chemotaxis family, sensor kinase CheA